MNNDTRTAHNYLKQGSHREIFELANALIDDKYSALDGNRYFHCYVDLLSMKIIGDYTREEIETAGYYKGINPEIFTDKV